MSASANGSVLALKQTTMEKVRYKPFHLGLHCFALRPRGYKTFSILISAEYEIFNAH